MTPHRTANIGYDLCSRAHRRHQSPTWGELATSVSGFSIVACLIANTLALSMLSALFAASADLVATMHFAGERGMLDVKAGLAEDAVLVDQYRGWFLDLPDQGEQIVNPAAIGGGFVFFNSFQPEGGSKGFCSDLGRSKSYQIPLFRPEAAQGREYGQGVPIPPIIVTVKLDSGEPSCQGPQCGEGEIPDEIVTVCIGCEGFDPVEIIPASNGAVREAYRAEDIDRL